MNKILIAVVLAALAAAFESCRPAPNFGYVAPPTAEERQHLYGDVGDESLRAQAPEYFTP